MGKTELCKALANFMFDSDDAIVAYRHVEFMEKHSIHVWWVRHSGICRL